MHSIATEAEGPKGTSNQRVDINNAIKMTTQLTYDGWEYNIDKCKERMNGNDGKYVDECKDHEPEH
jgi:hypothetical protein